jgi:hypothetical protein
LGPRRLSRAEEAVAARHFERIAQRARWRWIPLCGLLAPVVLAATVSLGGALRSDYNPVEGSISALGFGPHAIVVNGGFLAYGLLTIIFAFGLHRGITGGVGSALGPALVGLGSVAAVGLAIEWALLVSSFDSRRMPASMPELAERVPVAYAIHNGLALTSFLCPTIAGFALWRRLDDDWAWQGYATASGLVGIAASALLSYIVLGQAGILAASVLGWFGAVQRLLVGMLALWVAAFALRLFQGTREK